jgi:4-amino-4-deoxy-L-arabinose transferase-like glycosyltransferase
LADPASSLAILSLIAHLVSVLMGALAVIGAFHTGDDLWGRRTGWLSALFVALSFPLVYYTRTGNVDAMAMAFLMLSLAAATRCLCQGFTVRRALWLGAFAGCTLAAKESMIGLLVGVPFALLWQQFRTGGAPGLRDGRFWGTALRGLAVAIVCFGIGSGLFIQPERYLAHVAYLRDLLDRVAAGDCVVAFTYPFTWEGHLGYLGATASNLSSMLSPFGLAAAVVGIVLGARKRSFGALPALLAAVYLIYLFSTYRLVQVRYLMPVTAFLSLYAARAAAAAWEERRTLLCWAGSGAAAVAIVLAGLRMTELTYQMLNDSRYEAATWLAERTEPGDVVEYFGPSQKLPHIEAGVETRLATEFLGMYHPPRLDAAKVEEIRSSWAERRPRFVIQMRDRTSIEGRDYPGTCPPEIQDDLDRGDGVLELATTVHTPALIPWLSLPALDYPVINPPIRIYTRRDAD